MLTGLGNVAPGSQSVRSRTASDDAVTAAAAALFAASAPLARTNDDGPPTHSSKGAPADSAASTKPPAMTQGAPPAAWQPAATATATAAAAAAGATLPPPPKLAASGPPSRSLFPTGHVYGYIPQPQPGTALPHLPPQSGMMLQLAPTRQHPGSCCPPPAPEPLVPVTMETKADMVRHDAQRLLDPCAVMNRLVYDSLQAPTLGSPQSGGSGQRPSMATNRAAATRPASAAAPGQGAPDTGSGAPAAAADVADSSKFLVGVAASRPCSRQPTAEDALAALPPQSSSLPEGQADGACTGSSSASAHADSSPCSSSSACSSGSSGGGRFDYQPGVSAWYSPQGPDDTTLVFESRFECGNLRRAVQVYADEYDLILQPDINTRGHTQWYYFSVSNTRAGRPYKFNIINLLKEESLYNMGMLPLVHSELAYKAKGQGWQRSGSDVCWYANNIRRRFRDHYYTLTFTLEFDHDYDLVHVCHCYPFTYTDLQHCLWGAEQRLTAVVQPPPLQQPQQCETSAGQGAAVVEGCAATQPPAGETASSSGDAGSSAASGSGSSAGGVEAGGTPSTSTSTSHGSGSASRTRSWSGAGVLLSREPLCRSLAGNVCDVITITAPAGQGVPLAQRPGIILSSRVHPGETNASWMMKGAMDFLLSSSPEAQALRDGFVFKVIPMLNPDGVIAGNYRCSLVGLDLNRVWQEPRENLQPTIQAQKALIKRFQAERPVALFCDMHGHSRKFGIFMYGCEKKPRDGVPFLPGWPVPGSLGGLPEVPERHQDKLFPMLLHMAAPELFVFRSCNFKVQSSKAGTGRVVGFRELGLVNAFTIEASFCGPADTGQAQRVHFNTSHLEQMGAVLCSTLRDYWAPAASSPVPQLLQQLELLCPPGCAPSSSTRIVMTANGPVIEVVGGNDEDDAPTDSDDESSEEERQATVVKPAARSTSASAGTQGAVAAMAGLLFEGMSAADLTALAGSAGEEVAAAMQPLLSGQVDWEGVAAAAMAAAASGGADWQQAAAAAAAAAAMSKQVAPASALATDRGAAGEAGGCDSSSGSTNSGPAPSSGTVSIWLLGAGGRLAASTSNPQSLLLQPPAVPAAARPKGTLPTDLMVPGPDGTLVPLMALLLVGVTASVAASSSAKAAADASGLEGWEGAGRGAKKKKKGGKPKKGQRYGNPDFLREQAAKADAKLAAALPLLRAEANASSSRGSGAAGPATVAEGAAAARQLLEAARTSPGQHGLDLARYELLLLKEKKLAGGVLGSSNMAAAAAGGSAAGNGRPHSAGLLGLQHSTSAAGSHRQRDGEGVQPFKLMRSKTAVLPQQVRFSSSLVNGGRVSSDRSSAGD